MADSHHPDLQLRYWQAQTTFGVAAVEETMARSEWRERFPQLGLTPLENSVLLPEALIVAIASSRRCAYVFFADKDGERLFAEPSGARITGIHASRRQYSPAEALGIYGAQCLFEAVDNGVGYRGRRKRS